MRLLIQRAAKGSVSIDGKKNGYQVPNALNTLTIRVDTGDIRLTTQQPTA